MAICAKVASRHTSAISAYEEFYSIFEEDIMDKDRIKGSAEQAKGVVKEAAGKLLGDKKLETEGKTDQAVGKVQNAVGGLKDTLRGK